MTEPEWIVGPGAIWHHRLKRTDGAFPIRRGTAQRLGLRHPEPARPPMSFAGWAAAMQEAAKDLRLAGITIGQFANRRPS